MAGLLDDIFNTPEGRLGIGLLAMAGPQAKPMGFGERLAGAFQMQDAYKQQLADEESRKLRNEFQSEQMQGMRSRAAQERAAMEAAIRKQQALPSLFVGGEPALAPLMGDAESGILPSQGRPAKVGALDVQAALRAGYTPEEISKLDSLRNVGMDEVARTMTGMQGGREVSQQFDRFGRPVGAPLEQFRPAIMLNQGDKTVALDPISLTPKQSFQMGMSPESRASNALGWANNALARQRFEMESAKNAGDGYTFSPQLGGYVPKVPGGEFKPLAGIDGKGSLKTQEAMDALAIIERAKEIIPKATGSTIGAAMDAAGRAFGVSTSGDIATGQLKALEGALVAKMPKMTGPQSDRDVQIYRQMAAEIGDPTTPTPRKLAALQVVEEMQRRYAGVERQSGQTARGTVGNAPADIQQLLNKY